MTKSGPDFYDDNAVFDTYIHRRSRGDNPNDTLEKPIILELIGDITGKSVLDLGCGDGAMGHELLPISASMVPPTWRSWRHKPWLAQVDK